MKLDGRRADLYKSILDFQHNLWVASQCCLELTLTPTYIQTQKDLEELEVTKKWSKPKRRAFLKRMEHYNSLQEHMLKRALYYYLESGEVLAVIPKLDTMLDRDLTAKDISLLEGQKTNFLMNGGLFGKLGASYYEQPLDEKYLTYPQFTLEDKTDD